MVGGIERRKRGRIAGISNQIVQKGKKGGQEKGTGGGEKSKEKD
jgi:hypothetical protein